MSPERPKTQRSRRSDEAIPLVVIALLLCTCRAQQQTDGSGVQLERNREAKQQQGIRIEDGKNLDRVELLAADIPTAVQWRNLSLKSKPGYHNKYRNYLDIQYAILPLNDLPESVRAQFSEDVKYVPVFRFRDTTKRTLLWLELRIENLSEAKLELVDPEDRSAPGATEVITFTGLRKISETETLSGTVFRCVHK